MENINQSAASIKQELFDVVYRLNDLSTKAMRTIDLDAANELASAVHAINLAFEKLKACDLMVDAARDEQDQSYATVVSDE